MFWIREMFFTKTKVTTSLMGLEAAKDSIHEVRYTLWDLCLGVAIWRRRVSSQFFDTWNDHLSVSIHLCGCACVSGCGYL